MTLGGRKPRHNHQLLGLGTLVRLLSARGDDFPDDAELLEEDPRHPAASFRYVYTFSLTSTRVTPEVKLAMPVFRMGRNDDDIAHSLWTGRRERTRTISGTDMRKL
ncbi:hypothetical protein BCR34DRAFT_603299 [Clohesyomyces aquaticus]|uniref:Uncharacterized protein n=1 Tax=Clohesyomyces aquaticus TaxID=1231657 RepID=A0A1Y1ZEY8_9PLEO|nr:hypothetical protein BCR34DRAFT_603299 [Clohesyomyces aquaticus]